MGKSKHPVRGTIARYSERGGMLTKVRQTRYARDGLSELKVEFNHQGKSVAAHIPLEIIPSEDWLDNKSSGIVGKTIEFLYRFDSDTDEKRLVTKLLDFPTQSL